VVSVKYSLSSLLSAVVLAATTLLAGCGGGGAADPFAAAPTPPSLTVNPTVLNIYSGTPAVVTITSGVGPFQVFTSDAVVLPVAQVVSGAAVTLVANAISAEAPVTLTIRDSLGRTSTVAVVVKPSPLLGQLTVTQTSNSTCAGATSSVLDKAAICSGESGVASITIRSSATSVLPNRQIRFDVVQGAYNFLVDQNGTIAAKTITIVTDQNGKADAVVRMDAGVPSQSALIRATDVISGNRVDSAFSIVQAINGSAILSIFPSTYTASGKYKNECPGTAGDYLVYGGTPPYSIRSSLPNAIPLSVGGITSDPVIVTRSGGSFTASSFESSSCGDYSSSIVITDAAGRNASVTYIVKAGTEDRPAAAPLPTLEIVPKTVAFTAQPLVNGNCDARAVKFSVIGGSGSGAYSTSAGAISATGQWWGNTAVAPTPVPAPANRGLTLLGGETATIAYLDATAGKLVTAEIKCVIAAP